MQRLSSPPSTTSHPAWESHYHNLNKLMTRDRIENTLRAENNRGNHRTAVSVFAAFRKTAEKLKLLVEKE